MQESVLISYILITTHPQFNVLSGSLIECLEEPRHVGVNTAGSLWTNTLLPIPQGVVGVEVKHIAAVCVCISTSLTVVVTANVGRDLCITVAVAGTNPRCMRRDKAKINSICISPDMIFGSNPILRAKLCYGYSINIVSIDSCSVIKIVTIKSIRCAKLESS